MIRLQKIIAQAGITSRRKAEKLILESKVEVNGKKAKLGDKATTKDEITVDGILINQLEEKVYYVLNKPPKTITSLKDSLNRKTIIDLLEVKERVFPIGRLDYNTTGVLLLTNDGDLSHKLSHPSFEIIRVYRARIDKPLNKDETNLLNSKNVIINNQKSLQKVTKVDTKSYVISLHQGSYHHVKELFKLVNKQVLSLTRIEHAGINVIGMKRGKCRKLKSKEIKWLKSLTS